MTHRLYGELAEWWPLLSQRQSYAEESAHILGLIDEALGRPAQRILELGSGGGMLASHFGASREVVLSDRSPEMLAVAREHNAGRTTWSATCAACASTNASMPSSFMTRWYPPRRRLARGVRYRCRSPQPGRRLHGAAGW